jgi:hypothetical protein
MNIKLLPDNIIYEIMSYGYTKHRHFMRIINSRVKYNKIIDKVIYQFCLHNNRINNTLRSTIEFCYEMFSAETLIKLFKNSCKCFCCTKHSHYKPRSINIIDFNCDVSKINDIDYTNKIITCYCTCRQSSRCYWNSYNFDIL